ncbi:MAG: hypothetical protein RLZZ419_1087, partial [Pseudomonadota bacterium]
MTPLVKSNVSSQSRSNLSWAGCLIVLIWVKGAFSLAAADSSYKVTVNKTSFIQVKDLVTGVTVGNSDVANVTILDPNHLYILGKKLGSTNVILLCKRGPCNNATIQIEVTHNLEGLKAKLHELFPDELPKVMSSQGSIVLAGQVSSLQKMDAIL